MYEHIFDKCNVVYIKNKHNIENIIDSLKGKIVISDFKELNDVFNLKGILHIQNIDNKCINEKIDCIVAGKRNIELEAKLISLGSSIPIIYTNDSNISEDCYIKKWCFYCHTINKLNENNIISKYCSDECMTKNNKFMQNFKGDRINDLDIDNIKSKQYVLIEYDKNKSNSNKKTSENKFHTSIVKDAIRLEYAIKREIYKKEMRLPSLKRVSSSIKKNESNENENVKICKGFTKKGEKCNNKAIRNSNYCGIASHSKFALIN